MRRLPRRLVGELNQEHVSRDQIRTCFSERGWVAQDISRDLGEDILVQIYDEGRPSGLSFFVQAKSTRNSDKLRRRRGYIAYPIEAEHLECWEDSVPLTVIVVWDVKKKCGWWITVEAAIRELSARNPAWRTAKDKPTVRFPAADTMDDAGLSALRMLIAQYALPSIAKGREFVLETTLVFDNTLEGQAKLRDLQRCLSDGDTVRLERENIEKFEPPRWFDRAVGSIKPDHVIIGPGKSKAVHPARLIFNAPDGSCAEIPYLELKVLRAGSDRLTLSNFEQACPLLLECVLDRVAQKTTLSIKFSEPRIRIADAIQYMRFRATFAKGGAIQVVFLRDGRRWDGHVPASEHQAINPVWFDIAEKLPAIQQKTGVDFQIGPTWGFSATDIEKSRYAFQVCAEGRVVRSDQIVTVKIPPSDVLQLRSALAACDTECFEFHSSAPEETLELLGSSLALGERHAIATVQTARMLEVLDSLLSSAPVDATGLKAEVLAVHVVEEYSKFQSDDGSASDEAINPFRRIAQRGRRR